MSTSTDDRTIQLPAGRCLGYVELGDPDGLPLIFFHGTPGSRKMFDADELMARIPGLRLILPERPGYGLSDPQPDRALLDWPRDVVALADELDLDRFAVGGISGGGPHALACAHQLADRLTHTIVLASPAPACFRGATRGMAFGNRLAMFLGQRVPRLLRWMVEAQRQTFERDPDAFIGAFVKQLPEADQQALATETAQRAVARDLSEAFRQGSEAAFLDGRLGMTRSWGFDLAEISTPVTLWHGDDDVLVSRPMGEYLARTIPGCDARFVPAAGHMLSDVPAVVDEIRGVLGL